MNTSFLLLLLFLFLLLFYKLLFNVRNFLLRSI